MSDLATQLIAVLNEQIRCAQTMLGALGRENEALASGDTESLNAAGAEKARLVETLEALETERQGLVAVIEAELAPSDYRRSATPAWDSLLDLIAACQRQNQRNGALLKARSEQVRAALKLLRGAEPDLYDARGLRGEARSARPLASD